VTLAIYHLAAALAVIVVQTTVICHVPLLARFYDPALVVVAYLALFMPFWHGLGMAILLGAGVDQLSAAPFGLYFFAYLWLFLLVRWSALYLHVKSVFVLSLLMAAMVVGEHLLFGVLTALSASGSIFGHQTPNHAFHQSLWALGTGAAGIRLLLRGRSAVQSWRLQQQHPSNGHA